MDMETQPSTAIMLVDDHQLVRDGLRARLESIPHFSIVAEAGTAEEAINEASNKHIDVVLMDINLKSVTGIELARQFQDLFPDISVVMLSMYDTAEYVFRAIMAGARGYVLKAAPAIEVVTAIDTVMEGGVYYSPALNKYLARAVSLSMLLTPREKEILQRIAVGKSNKHTARELNLSVRTVEAHRWNIKRKLNIGERDDLVQLALEYALVCNKNVSPQVGIKA